MNIPTDPNVKKLANTFGLDLPEYYFVVEDYALENGSIVIKKIKVLDKNGKFLQYANNKNAIHSLNKFPTAFDKI